MRKAPMTVASSARPFINPLKGLRNDMLRKATKHATTPESGPNKRYAITAGIPITSNFKLTRIGKGTFKENILDNQSRTTTVAPRRVVPAMNTLFLSV
jgi:hypothetical protein